MVSLRNFYETIRKNNLRNLRLVLWLVYLAITAIGIIRHKPWRDEAYVWLMAQNINFHDFITFFSYVGHPPLWYVLNIAIAQVGLPFAVVQFFNWTISGAIAWLFLFRSPFNLILTITFLCTVNMLFQFSVVTRSYGLMLLLFYLCIKYYPKRLIYPTRYAVLLLLLINSETYVLMPAFLFSVFFCSDLTAQSRGNFFARKKILIPLIIILCGFLVAVISLWPPDDISRKLSGFRFLPAIFFSSMQKAFLPFPEQLSLSLDVNLVHAQQQNYILNFLAYLYSISNSLLIAPICFMLVFIVYAIQNNKRALLLYISLIGWFWFIVTFKYTGNYYHAALIIPFCMGTFWFFYQNYTGEILAKRFVIVMLLIFFLYGDMIAAIKYKEESTIPYSGLSDAAKFLQHHNYRAKIIAMTGCNKTSAVLAFLPGANAWDVGRDRTDEHYMLWDKTWDKCLAVPTDEMISRIQNKSTPNFIILASEPLDLKKYNLRLLYSSKGIWESYWIYEFILAEPILVINKFKTYLNCPDKLKKTLLGM